MHPTYLAMTKARIQAAVDAAKSVSQVQHSGLKGQLREILVRDIFRPLLPADIGLGSGEIITADGRTSRQTDVVMYDRYILPPILLEGSTGIFPIESVLYTVEVKSRLSVADMRSAIEAADVVGDMQCPVGCTVEHRSERHRIIPTLFAFDVAFSVETSEVGERLRQLRPGPYSGLAAICIVGVGYWYWSSMDGAFRSYPRRYPLEEVVGFVAGLVNTYRMIADSRSRIPLEGYLQDWEYPAH